MNYFLNTCHTIISKIGALLGLWKYEIYRDEFRTNSFESFREPRESDDVPQHKIINVQPRYDENNIAQSTNMRFVFKDVLLDRLNEHFKYMRHLKGSDFESYNLLRQNGSVLTATYAWKETKLSKWFLENRPAFGCVLYAGEQFDKTDKIFPRLFHFRKYKKAPLSIQPTNGDGDVYVVGVLWHTDEMVQKLGKSFKDGVSSEFAVWVKSNGDVKALRVRETGERIVTPRRGNKFYVPNKGWTIPKWHKDWASDNNKDPLEFLADMFIKSVSAYEMSSMQETIEIRATKGGVTAVFGVDVERTPYFFKDRVSISGTKKRIFHIVRPHDRVRKGKSTTVKMHFRGERLFKWNGYNIEITVPIRDGWKLVSETGPLGGYDLNALLKDGDNVGDFITEDHLTNEVERARRAAISRHTNIHYSHES